MKKVWIRTLCRSHMVLHSLRDGSEKYRSKIIARGFFTWASGVLQRLLEWGLIYRTHPDTKIRAKYTISKRGKEVYDMLQELQPIHEDMYIRENPPTPMNPDGDRIFTGSPKRGYRKIKVEVCPEPHWVEYFKHRVW